MSRQMVCSYTGKKIFWDQRTAGKKCGKINKHSRQHLFAYKCKQCGHWHLAKYKKKREEPDDESVPN